VKTKTAGSYEDGHVVAYLNR